jgi:hypothetical protein
MDMGKLLFSFVIDDGLDWTEFLYMGRAIQYRNSKNMAVIGMAAIILSVVLSFAVSPFFILLLLIIGVEAVVYMEYGARNIARNLRAKLPISYDFYEDGLVETMGGVSSMILYSKFKAVKVNQHVFTLVGRKSDVVVVPRCLIGDDADALLMKLRMIIGG